MNAPRTAPKSDFLGVSELAALRAENARLREALKGLRDWCDENINGSPLVYSQRMEAADAALKGEA